jgi:hypothetical protein
MGAQALPTRTAVGARMVRRMVAAVGNGVAGVASRRRRDGALRRGARQREEFAGSWTAGLSRGLTLFVADRDTAPRRGER